MRSKRVVCLLLLCALFLAGCSAEEFNNTLSQLRGSLKKIKEDTVYENKYFGMTFTGPKDWWIYDLNESAFSPETSADPALWVRQEFEDTEEYYVDMVYIGSQRDTSSPNHASFMIFVENFPEMESLEAFANLTATFYETTENNYTTINYGEEMLEHNGTVYYRLDFETTHPDNEVSMLSHYYVCQAQGLYVTVYIDYWEGEAEAKRAAEAIFDSLTITKGAQPDA